MLLACARSTAHTAIRTLCSDEKGAAVDEIALAQRELDRSAFQLFGRPAADLPPDQLHQTALFLAWANLDAWEQHDDNALAGLVTEFRIVQDERPEAGRG